MMSAERNLSAVSAESASGTSAQTPARIHGMDDSGGRVFAKNEKLLPYPVPPYSRGWKCSDRARRKISGRAVEVVLLSMGNFRIKFSRHD
jgi:hypothetical protein